MAAESLVSFLLDKLASFVENEIPLLKGDRQEALFLRGELERMRALLKIADALEESDEELKVWLKQVREIVYETEDALDEYRLIQAHDQCHGLGLYGYLHKFSCCIKSMKARSRIISELNCINSRIKNISEVHERLLPKFTRAEQGSGITSAGNTWEYRRGDALLLDKTDLVGIDEPKQQLVEWLVKGGYGREVVSVAAMGGMGKTTLAKQVYDDPEVKKHFKRRAWITVSQSFKMEELLRDMIHQIYSVVSRPVPEGLDSMNKDRLRRIVKDLLQKRRYLIVLDDVWHLYEWDALKYAMPNNNCGSRIILTTRNADVASSSGVESVGKVYNLKPLTPEESWQLFSRKTFQLNACPSYLKKICQYTLKKCEGLPLAIVAISGVLATKDKRRTDEWNMVGRSLGAEIDGNDKLQDLKKVLSLSFNDLPFYLRSCFLYLSIFPEDYRIEQMRVIRLWIAEGFIEAKEGKTLEEVAEDYLNELLNRGLLQVAGTTTDGRVKLYRIHDLLREIVVSKARDQNFTSIAKDHNMTRPDKVRRLAIHNSLQNIQENRSVSRLRSLFIFRVLEKLYIQRLFPGGFKLLSVLDLQNARLNKFPMDIVNLYYLKYLSFRSTKVKTIPSLIGKLQNLETLDLKHSRVTELPVEILKLQRLRHLLVYHLELESYEYFHSRYGFKVQGNIGALRSLQKLCFIEANQCSDTIMLELGKLYQLRRLGIVKLRKEDGKSLCSSLTKLTNLRALSLTSIEEEEILDLQHLSSPPPLIQRVYLRGRLETLPHWIPSLHGLVRLSLKWSRLMDDPLVLLQNLPNLVHLELLQAFEGDTLYFRTGGFKKLKVLGLDEFSELRCMQVEAGAMPCVEKLIIQRCEFLKRVPIGIEYLTNLKVLEFFDMPEEFIQTLRPDEKQSDYWKVAHIPEVYSTYWREGGWEVNPLDLGDGENFPRPGTITRRDHELQSLWK
ncbi:disease resistance protein RPM1-like [Juglans microcarpa x Juglans regia]|uniref:disease resistance protein RPM1-like n=1 Tax=Juglans microcarpa x Juglans regia TaxID=2249226 RepID=UPI001B7F66F6|nr:disease resistance protein RPM1-like [Juglans microcarpa x Juglans regia]